MHSIHNLHDQSHAMTTPIELPCVAEQFLPHRPPMLLISRLLERQGDTAVAEAVIPRGGLFVDPEKGLLPEYFIEIIAQTLAATSGYDALLDHAPQNDGFLVGVDNFIWPTQQAEPESVRIHIEKTFEFGGVTIIHGQVLAGEHLLAQGDIKVWENKSQEKSTND